MEVPFYLYLNVLAIFIWLIFRERLQVNMMVLGYYLIFCFTCESFAWLYSYFTYRSNHWAYNVFTGLQTLFLCSIYLQILSTARMQQAIRVFLVAYPALFLVNVLFVQSFFKFHTYTYVFSCVFIIVLVFSYFNQMLQTKEVIPLRRNGIFWFNLGNLIYFVGSIFYMGSINFILETGHDYFGRLINIFVYSFTSVQYSLFIMAMVCNLKRPQSSF
jgi:hypothetical protein